MRVSIVSILTAFFGFIYGQVGSIEGIVKDMKTDEPLIGANIVIVGTYQGAAVDQSGHFVISNISAGTYNIEASMIGYTTVARKVTVAEGQKITLIFLLEETVIEQPGIIISAEKLIEKTAVSAQAIPGVDLRKSHGIIEDPMHALTAMPGIAIGEEFATWLCVRGGAPNENLWLLDWVPVYWPYHFGGMKSVFNSEMIENLELYTGGFPPKFGDKLSSIINITSREGTKDSFKGKANLSLINALGVIEGPLTDKGSYICSARRSYYDLVISTEKGFTLPSFYDIQTRVGYNPEPGHKLYFSGLVSGERVKVEFEDPEPGQPSRLEDYYLVTSSSAEWKWLINSDLYSMVVLTFQSAIIQFELNQWWIDTKVWEPGIRQDLTWQFNNGHTMKTGFEFRRPVVDWASFIPLNPTSQTVWTDTTLQGARREIKGDLWLGSFYVQDGWDISKRFTSTFGLRYDNNSMTKNGTVSPRISMRYEFDVATAIRSAFGYYYQKNELEEMIENNELETKLAKHYIVGLERAFTHEIRSWIEVYYKDYSRLLIVDTMGHYTNGGFGYGRGLEFFIEKKGNPVSGWLSYALSWAERREYTDEELGWFDYDQRHMLSCELDFEFGKTWSLDLHWRYSSGRPYTPVVQGVQDTLGNWIPIEGEKNSERYPTYHRLDMTLNKDFSLWGTKLNVYIKLLNAYYRKNTQGYSYGYEEDGTPIPEPYYGIPIIPAIGFSLEF